MLGYHRDPQRLPGEFRPVVPHPGAGSDAAVGDLNSAPQPCRIPGCQGIDGQHRRSADLPGDSADQPGGFDAGLTQHPRRQHRHRPEPPEELFPACHMAGSQHPAGRPWPQGIRGDGGIAQTGHQQCPLRGQQRRQALAQQGGLGSAGQGCFTDGVGFQGDVPPRRFADGAGALFVLDGDGGELKAVLLHPADGDAGQLRFAGKGGGFQGKILIRIHGKISSLSDKIPETRIFLSFTEKISLKQLHLLRKNDKLTCTV